MSSTKILTLILVFIQIEARVSITYKSFLICHLNKSSGYLDSGIYYPNVLLSRVEQQVPVPVFMSLIVWLGAQHIYKSA